MSGHSVVIKLWCNLNHRSCTHKVMNFGNKIYSTQPAKQNKLRVTSTLSGNRLTPL